MSFVNVMIHAVWGTKSRQPLLQKEARKIIFDHIKTNARTKGLYIDSINGMEDHVHLLLGLNADISIAKTIQLIKGESSCWINKQSLLLKKFEWADEYYAASVSESLRSRVRNYILQQEEHHRLKTFTEEYEDFFKNYNFQRAQG